MRILHCIPSMGGGGAERQLVYLADEMMLRGWEVHVALLHDGPNLKYLHETKVIIHKIFGLGNYDPRILFQLFKIVRAIKPDLIQVWLLQMEIIGGLTALRLGIPWIFSERASAFAYPITIKNVIRIYFASRADAIVSNSWQGDQYWKKKLDSKSLRYVIPNAIPFEKIEAASSVLEKINRIRPDSRFLLFIGRLDKQKNPKILLKALSEVMKQFELSAVLCGDGPLRAELEREVEKYGLNDRVALPGYVPEVWGLLKCASLFVSVSLFEGQPNTVLEAIACGCPLVVSDIPEHREFLDEKTALLINPHDSQAIAEAIANVLLRPEDALRRAENARLLAEQWSVAAIAQRYEQMYLQVLERHSRAGIR